MSQTQSDLPVPPSKARRLPAPGWPVWVVFAALFVPGLILLGVLGGAKDDAAERLGFVRDAEGRSLVLTGEFDGIETNPGLPTATGQYTVTIPDADGVPGQTVVLGGDDHWGFPPSPDYPAELDFLVVLDDPPRAAAHGPVGSLEPVTAESVDEARGAVGTAQTLWVVGIVVFWVGALGLPALAIALTVRRRRARHSLAPPPRL